MECHTQIAPDASTFLNIIVVCLVRALHRAFSPCTERPAAMGTSRVVPALLGLSAFAFYITWGASLSNGTLDRMLHIRGAAVPCIPGTHEPLRLRFTGIAPIDYWCTIMVLFFWEAVDGSHPTTSMNGIYFLGQLVGIWTLVWVEGIRRGERHMVAK